MKTIQLKEPVKRGEEKITKVKLRKPKTGELRGLKMAEILLMDVDAMMTLIPRLCELTPAEIGQLDPVDFTALSVNVISFFGREGSLGV